MHANIHAARIISRTYRELRFLDVPADRALLMARSQILNLRNAPKTGADLRAAAAAIMSLSDETFRSVRDTLRAEFGW